jgi:hypothetical protein
MILKRILKKSGVKIQLGLFVRGFYQVAIAGEDGHIP